MALRRRIMLDVALFGHVNLTYGGKYLPFAVRPRLAPLLAYLLLNCRQPVSRNSVAFALWPDEPEAAAQANLRRHLQYLRELLPPSRTPWIIADKRSVCWNPAARVRVDVAVFEELIADEERLAEAVDCYGELLQACDDEWLLAIRERLHRSYVRGLFELIRRARGRRDCSSASNYLGRILADDPWREDALRALMVVRCEAGDRSSALQLCTEFEQRLESEMGATLMPETTALRYAIERGNPLPAIPLAPSSPHAAPLPSPDLPFEGRNSELARLHELWDRTVAGAGAFALVTGEAGIGKTRLASEFALAVEASGARVFWGTTSAPETTPYQAVAEVARAGLGFVDLSLLSGYDLDVLSRLIPELRDGEIQKELGGPDAAKLFEVVGDLFIELARARPALFVLEDLHAAGRATIAMLENLAQRCRQAPLLILSTLREEEPRSGETLGRLRRLADAPAPALIPLAPLPDEAVQSIVAQSVGRSVDSKLVAERAAGHPLFLTELLYATADAGGQADVGLPTRLREMIETRNRQFSQGAAFLLGAAAVVGNSFDVEVVAEAVGWNESRLAAAIDELIARRAIRQTPSTRSFEYEFAHDLIASAAYDSVPEAQRRQWHRRAARAAEHLYTARLAELSAFVARHFDLGGERDSAARYYLRAAQQAVSAFANDEALASARRGLALRPSSASDRYELLALIERVLARTGDRAGQTAIFNRLERVVHKLGDGERLRELLDRRATLQFNLGDHKAARRTLARLYRLAAGDARWEATALTDEAMVLNHSGRKAEAYATITRAAARATAANAPEILSTTLTFNADIAASVGRRAEAEECLQRAKAASTEVGSPFLMMDVLLCEAAVFVHFQAWPRILEPAHQLLDLATTVGNKNRIASAHMMLGAARGKLLDPEKARVHFRAAIDLFRGRNVHGLFFAYHNLAEIEVGIGRLDSAQRLLDEIATALPPLNSEHRAMTSIVASQIARQRGDYDAAIALAASALSATTALGNKLYEAEWLLCKGLALRASGRNADATSPLEDCLTICGSSGVKAVGNRAAAELALAYAIANDARTASLADEALASIESDVDAIDAPAALWAISQALEASGRNAQARKALVRAHAEFKTRCKRLQNRDDRIAFSRIAENADLERAYASVPSHNIHQKILPSMRARLV